MRAGSAAPSCPVWRRKPLPYPSRGRRPPRAMPSRPRYRNGFPLGSGLTGNSRCVWMPPSPQSRRVGAGRKPRRSAPASRKSAGGNGRSFCKKLPMPPSCSERSSSNTPPWRGDRHKETLCVMKLRIWSAVCPNMRNGRRYAGRSHSSAGR